MHGRRQTAKAMTLINTVGNWPHSTALQDAISQGSFLYRTAGLHSDRYDTIQYIYVRSKTDEMVSLI